MIKFDKPKSYNGGQLFDEIVSAGILINDKPMTDENGDLVLDISEKDKSKVQIIVSKHEGFDYYIKPEKVALLEKLGITADEAKLLLL